MSPHTLPELEVCQESLFFPACGPQADSTKPSKPQWRQSTATRDQEHAVYKGEKLVEDALGKHSPGPAKYTPKRQKKDPSWVFGTAPARPPQAKAKYPDPCNDLLGTIPDNQQFRYSKSVPVIGSSFRGAPTVTPDLDSFPLGGCSPGPQRYRPEKARPAHRFAWSPEADKVPPSYTMRPKTKILEEGIGTTERVGPGSYPNEAAVARQSDSRKPSQPQWGINRHDRFIPKREHGDAGRMWDGMGQRKLQFSRAFSQAPSAGFGTSTRFDWSKTAPCKTKKDMGPAANMPKPRKDAPSCMPTAKDTAKFGPGGAPP